MSRIVITGMGAVTPVGIGTDRYLEAIGGGVCGIDRITKIDTENLAVKIAGEVKNFDPLDYIPRKTAENMVDFMHYAYAAAEEALRDSGMEVDPFRTGIMMGTALDGLAEISRTQQAADLGKKVGPKFLTKVLGNLAPAQFAIAHGIKGPSMTVNTACSSGGDAITMAAMMLRAGDADAMVVMAGEASVNELLIGSLTRSQALTRVHNDDPTHASRPFDADRSGFVIGEGGGALVLETLEHARKRGARIHGELVGYANNTDAYHMVAPHPQGEGAAACVRAALRRAGLAPEQIGYLNAHGTSTPAGDIAEANAIRAVFGDWTDQLPVSSTKGATGHLMGAGGITEVIACIGAVRDGILPVNLNYDTPDPQCDLHVVASVGAKADVAYAMSNSLGFGGQNACIIVGKYRD